MTDPAGGRIREKHVGLQFDINDFSVAEGLRFRNVFRRNIGYLVFEPGITAAKQTPWIYGHGFERLHGIGIFCDQDTDLKSQGKQESGKEYFFIHDALPAPAWCDFQNFAADRRMTAKTAKSGAASI